MSTSSQDDEDTYRSLGLGRAPLRLDGASGFRERAVALGGEAPEYPRILIGRSRYEEVLNRLVAARLLRSPGDPSLFSEGFLATYFRQRLRFATYDEILQGYGPRADLASNGKPAERRANLYRRTLVQRLLTHIEGRRMSSRPWLDLVWQKIVGPRIAAESQLVRVDRDAQRAILRSLNASLAFALRRRADLPSQLSDALGIPIREIRVIT
ncbi:hypothetical protein [Methylacidimicrobium sp. B4]|uniref:hypothetical protein n=1 Tax=Methylacidimicrobium sp. B4 TaxID=2796139 RepID=UPI001A8EED48|nr:hypothetical protein [Methylacidimicrobium sp. B4]QSR85081.1 hypothetical protein MacB4_02085 [Methylacidimicrobium sp. B4]